MRTSASIPTDPRNKPVCHLFYTMGVKNISKRAVNMKLLDTWKWQIHMSHAHAQGKCILLDAQTNYWNARKIYWMHGCRECAHIIPCTAQTVESVKKKIHAS